MLSAGHQAFSHAHAVLATTTAEVPHARAIVACGDRSLVASSHVPCHDDFQGAHSSAQPCGAQTSESEHMQLRMTAVWTSSRTGERTGSLAIHADIGPVFVKRTRTGSLSPWLANCFPSHLSPNFPCTRCSEALHSGGSKESHVRLRQSAAAW